MQRVGGEQSNITKSEGSSICKLYGPLLFLTLPFTSPITVFPSVSLNFRALNALTVPFLIADLVTLTFLLGALRLYFHA